jgi:predicted nucleic acid-binding protein
MEISAAGLFRAKWTDKIHDEWTRNLLKNRADLTSQQLQRTKDLMNTAVPDCLVEGYEALEQSVKLPDHGDHHVLAAAIHCKADAIITFNLKHFPSSALGPYEIEAQHPDEFIHHQIGLNHAGVLIAARRCRLRLKNPPKAADEYLRALESQSLPKTVDALRDYSSII